MLIADRTQLFIIPTTQATNISTDPYECADGAVLVHAFQLKCI
jgi:hypothetical protein